ncbi:MAG: hypothetical protein HYW79_00270 [Parcubacteria group bacterium]|nr:hypothetical protein [Parcubacteria group bacterium]
MDENRRKFLKIILIGGGAILAEKVLTPLFSFLNDSSAKTGLLNKTSFGNFKIVENKEKLSIRDSSGEEIFQIDDEA